LLTILYSQIARARRRYYERRPHLRRRLAAPVISVGNLTVGGSSKTPLAAGIARMLLDMGERPSILSRGYAREIVEDGTVIVSDGKAVLADVARSGDEPLMLARQVPRAAVLVSSSRYVSGRVAESKLGCTVHVLDDGFQHFDLVRDVDLLVAPATLDDTRTLPFGRFREPLDAAASADALLVELDAVAQGFSPVAHDSVAQLAARLKVPIAFEFSRRIAGPPADRPAFAFAGIARPERFFADLEKAGWRLTGRRAFADHHRYSDREIDDIAAAAAASGAQVILTTEKDLVRLRPGANIVPVPLEVSIAPSFGPWLAERLRTARASGRVA
jgi:tetraacyldisaccharide 4'-kinase